MLHVEKVLVPADFSIQSRRLMDLVRPIIESTDAELHLLHGKEAAFDETPELELPDEIAVVHERFSDEVSVDAVIDYCERESIDLIATGADGRWSLIHRTPSVLASGVVRRTDYPVLRVPLAEEMENIDARDVDRILVPIDFSDYAVVSLQHARELADAYQASLLLYFVAEEHTVAVFSDAGVPNISTMKADPEIADKADEALQQLYESAGGPEAPVSYHVGHGHAAREILDFADEKAVDLVVMATHGLSGHEPFSLGSVTEKVLRRTHHPVFVLKAFGHSLLV